MNILLTSKDKRFLFICAIIAAASLWVGINYFYNAFPEASIDFAVSQNQAKDIAETFLKERGADVGTYNYGGIFGYDDSVKTFLEKEMGLEKANAQMGTTLHLWRWANRWFKPLQKEEYSVSVTTRGEVVRYSHLIPEEREAPAIDKQTARAKAEEFLSTVMKRDISKLEFVEDQTQQRPKRTDFTFTWKEKDWSFQDASHRVSVEVDGDAIGAYSDFVHVPDQWMRSFAELRSKNNIASTVDLFFMALLIVGILVVIVQKLRRRDLRWRTALIFGGITAVLTFLASMNVFSLVKFGYNTTDTYGAFLSRQILFAVLGAVTQGLSIAVFTVAAESLYREYMPGVMSLPNFFRRRTIRTKSFFISVVLGLTLTCFFFAYQTIFYLAANKLGAWAPADVPFDNLMNTAFPWVFVLLGGFFPAVFEEFVFRMFAIPFLHKLFKMRWLAIVLAAFIWGFGHSGYPNEPFFIRGLEVGIAGVIIGFVMLRYGILATLVWHYTVDALYGAILMIRSGNPYYVGSGAVSAGIMLIPLAICVIAYLRHKSFAEEHDLTNASEPVAPPLPEEEPVVSEKAPDSYTPLPKRTIGFGLIVAAAFAATLFIPVTKIGDNVEFNISRDGAESSATAFMQSQGVETEGWHVVVYEHHLMDAHADHYILSRRDVATLNTVYGKTLQPSVWGVRYFKELQKDEYRVYVHPGNGTIYGFVHEMPDSTPGPSLTVDSAQAIALSFLNSHDINVAGFVMKESKAEDKKARRDYTFTWEAPPGSPLNIDSANLRVQVLVTGARVAQVKRFMKLPEDWVRQEEETTTLTIVHTGLNIALGLGLFVFAIWIFIRRIRQSAVRWKTAILGGAIFAVYGLLELANHFPGILETYPTTQTFAQFYGMMGFGLGSAGLFAVIGVVALVGLIDSIYPEALPNLCGMKFRTRARDAAIVAVVFTGISLGIGHLQKIIVMLLPGSAGNDTISGPSDIGSFLPAESIIGGSLIAAVLLASVMGMSIYLINHHLQKKSTLIAVLAAAIVIWFLPNKGTPVEMAAHLIYGFVYAGFLIAMLKWFLRDNTVSYLAALFVASLVDGALQYGVFSSAFYHWNGVIAGVLAVMTVGVLLLRGKGEGAGVRG